MSESYLDRPQDDNTPKAHPAFNRGKIDGIRTVLSIFKNVINGTDTGTGEIASPQIESIRKAIFTYKDTLEHASDKSTYLSKQAAESLQEAKNIVDKINL
jgi:hypothetical protein|tara:strand:- start:410 stop:709 length:300 start_codon:yes stop_codon:yes gene_type:complete